MKTKKTEKVKIRGNHIQKENDGRLCICCGEQIKKGQEYEILYPDYNVNYERYYHERTCSPGSESWAKFSGSELAYLLWDKNKIKEEESDADILSLS